MDSKKTTAFVKTSKAFEGLSSLQINSSFFDDKQVIQN
jgi:hypothetical protein